MTIINITKAQIMKAVAKEPLRTLRPNGWVDGIADWHEPLKNADCTVCAVGAVLRQVLDPNEAIVKIQRAALAATEGFDVICDETGTLSEIRRQALSTLQRGAPMAALSTYFEGLCRHFADKSGHCAVIKDGKYYVVDDFVGFSRTTRMRAKRMLKSPSEIRERNRNSGLSQDEIKLIREKVVAFVARHFPATMQIDIDGAKPAQDSWIVKDSE